ncbi:ATP-binding protein [Dactylosporangium sp. AC04546]|uniref:ATP-binding protein n=1 Tax=Dactylosporangium sp. AC04546 TaxID=2862460 RepID=UPI001EDECC6B|nr:ATP-binding protein [Dactylosporangium sp. AC04546]WVK82345.1 ATP-binding protein [Dactylosporangium sp. AC04546]
MNEDERKALAALRFDWAPVPDDVWRPSMFHVEGLHQGVVNDVLAGMADAHKSADGSPLGLVLKGRRGSGKTHMLGWVRQQIQDQGGYFFLVSVLDAKGFWESVLDSMLSGLFRTVPGSDTQMRLFLRRLSSVVGAPRSARRAVMGETELTPAALDAFLQGLADHDREVARECDDTARAIALSASDDVTHRDLAENYFSSEPDADPEERTKWRMRRRPRTAQEIVRELSRLLALTGPSVMAVDQIDTLISQSSITSQEGQPIEPSSTGDWAQILVLEQLAHGLMALREYTRRTLTLVACIPPSWMLIKSRTTDTVRDRFREPAEMLTIQKPAIARTLIEKRFAHSYRQVRFTPPYPTWPVRPEAFDTAVKHTPRQLLIEIDEHVRNCLLHDEVRELRKLGDPPSAEQSAAPQLAPTDIPDDVRDQLDARFAELRDEADVAAPLNPDREDAVVPGLLSAGLMAWIIEQGAAEETLSQDGPPSAKPALHARLRRTLDEDNEDQAHWSFRAISAKHHGVAALHRIRRAAMAAGVDGRVSKRRLYFLRNGAWSGPKTLTVIDELKGRNTATIAFGESDLRTLAALKVLLDEAHVDLRAWLMARRPASKIEIFRRAMADLERPETTEPNAMAGGSPAVPHLAVNGASSVVPMLTVGHDYATGAPVRMAMESLRKHVAIFAGSGSGKTVLIRRLVEECALEGVSAIVLDPNNDLARLGDPWPAPPDAWGAGDAEKAAAFIAGTEVLVWTPRRETGRPLSFQPLPDFRSVLDDPDEFNEAVDSAVAALTPRARLDSRAAKAHLGLAVLRRAVDHYGRRGGGTLRGLIDTLADLPNGVSELDGADKIASGLAQTLTASIDNDPMFGGDSTPLDPAILLTPSHGKRARISVISLVGLPSEDMRQSFVNQLEMALFAYIKKHPAGDRPLLGLFVMDEAQTLAPSGTMTACTQSTLALASQARKYGLGLVFATQAPKGLHNRIPGNAATQFFGLLNSPIQIDAAREMAKAKGGDVPDVSRLRSGEFYLAAEGEAPQKVRTPLCLSYHPRSPLTTEEVLERSRLD